MPSINFTSNLKRFFPELISFESESTNLNDLINQLEGKYTGIKSYLLDDKDSLREHINIYIGQDLIRDRINLSDSLKPEDRILIMQAISGG